MEQSEKEELIQKTINEVAESIKDESDEEEEDYSHEKKGFEDAIKWKTGEISEISPDASTIIDNVMEIIEGDAKYDLLEISNLDEADYLDRAFEIVFDAYAIEFSYYYKFKEFNEIAVELVESFPKELLEVRESNMSDFEKKEEDKKKRIALEKQNKKLYDNALEFKKGCLKIDDHENKQEIIEFWENVTIIVENIKIRNVDEYIDKCDDEYRKYHWNIGLQIKRI